MKLEQNSLKPTLHVYSVHINKDDVEDLSLKHLDSQCFEVIKNDHFQQMLSCV